MEVVLGVALASLEEAAVSLPVLAVLSLEDLLEAMGVA
jgi:hypothetical protein